MKLCCNTVTDPELWSQTLSLLSSFSLVGHSLVAALLCQQFACSETDGGPLAETLSKVCAVLRVNSSIFFLVGEGPGGRGMGGCVGREGAVG